MTNQLDLNDHLWPTPAQETLLKAALTEDESAIEHFHAWCDMIDLAAEFDRGSYRLLPLLYANMSRLGVNHSLMGRLKGTYRRTWCEAQRTLEQARDVLNLFRAHDIETLLIKGIPLAIGYYGNEALRPMADFDIVVPHAKAMQAINLLDERGWKRGQFSRDEDVIFHHAMQFFHPKGGEVDVHWHILSECRSVDAGRHFRACTEPLEVKGVATRQLGPTDTLFHTVVHGIRWNAEPPIRWIPDALTILRKAGPAIDWDRILVFAERERLSYRLRLGLAFLAERFAAPIPEYVLETLKRRRITMLERIENTVALHDGDKLYENPLTKTWVIFVRYSRFQQARGVLSFLDGLSHYIRIEWALGGRSEIPVAVARGLLHRLFRHKRAGGGTYRP